MTEPIPDFDLYGTLGVPRGTPPNAVVAAYRGLIRRAHPDVSSEAGSSERSKQLNIARDWLVDPVRRARYDAARPGPADVRDRARSATPRSRQDVDRQAAAWRAELEVFEAHCRAMSRRELSRLLASARDEGPAKEIAARMARLAQRSGRAARIAA
jgi:DnaJ-class molecular chaperone